MPPRASLMKRRTNSLRKVYCDYCGRETEYVDSKVIYGKSYGKIYLCRNCMAYVGVHKGTDKPLGRLANAELRNWKKAAHAVFDPLWKYGRFRGHRNAAYAWLAQKMGLQIGKEVQTGTFGADMKVELVNDGPVTIWIDSQNKE